MDQWIVALECSFQSPPRAIDRSTRHRSNRSIDRMVVVSFRSDRIDRSIDRMVVASIDPSRDRTSSHRAGRRGRSRSRARGTRGRVVIGRCVRTREARSHGTGLDSTIETDRDRSRPIDRSIDRSIERMHETTRPIRSIDRSIDPSIETDREDDLRSRGAWRVSERIHACDRARGRGVDGDARHTARAEGRREPWRLCSPKCARGRKRPSRWRRKRCCTRNWDARSSGRSDGRARGIARRSWRCPRSGSRRSRRRIKLC